MDSNWQNYVTNSNDPDWKEMLLRILKCWGHIHDDWYENYWNKFGITREEGRKIVAAYEKFDKGKV
jgi:hypothetical protein